MFSFQWESITSYFTLCSMITACAYKWWNHVWAKRTWGPAAPRSPGRPALPASPWGRAGKLWRRGSKLYYLTLTHLMVWLNAAREIKLTSSPFFPGGPGGPREPNGPCEQQRQKKNHKLPVKYSCFWCSMFLTGFIMSYCVTLTPNFKSKRKQKILTGAPGSPGSPGGPVNPWGPCEKYR